MENMEFDPSIFDKLNHYVYRLVDPRNGQTFYVGEGRGNRVFDHVKWAEQQNAKGFYETLGTEEERAVLKDKDIKNIDNVDKYAKLETIKAIQADGLQVIHIIQRYGMDKKTAHEVESALIDLYGLESLTNQIKGHDAERGMKYTQKLKYILEAKEYEDLDEFKPYMIIKVRQSTIDYYISEKGMNNKDAIYEATKGWWKKIAPNKANKCKYVLSVVDGIVKAVYCNVVWDNDSNSEGRRSFTADYCNDLIVLNHFFKNVENKQGNIEGKQGFKIPEKYRKKGMASPCLYSKP